MIRVLLVDDQQLVREGFRAILESNDDLEVAGEAADGESAIRVCREVRPDVILMDVRMPGLDGLEAAKRILSGDDPPRILMLTTFDLDEYVYEAMKAGASGFLLKDAPRAQLLAGIRTVAAGETMLAESVIRRLVEQFVKHPPGGSPKPPSLEALSEREVDVLRLVARGLSNREIAEHMFLSEATVKTHVAHLLAKLGLRDRVQAVVRAYETGLVQPGD